MAPTRIIIIRHAEEHDVVGVTAEGERDAQSLTVKGWQRAGALVRLFYPGERSLLTPDVLFASAVGPGSRSQRPRQTIGPLYARLRKEGPIDYNEAFAKPDTGPLMEAVLACQGTVLIAWEHSQIPRCVAALPNPPQVPEQWPTHRYDLMWQFHRRDGGWDFEQVPQNLLAYDRGNALSWFAFECRASVILLVVTIMDENRIPAHQRDAFGRMAHLFCELHCKLEARSCSRAPLHPADHTE